MAKVTVICPGHDVKLPIDLPRACFEKEPDWDKKYQVVLVGEYKVRVKGPKKSHETGKIPMLESAWTAARNLLKKRYSIEASRLFQPIGIG